MKLWVAACVVACMALVIGPAHAGQLTTKTGCVKANGVCVVVDDNEIDPKGSGSPTPPDQFIGEGSSSSFDGGNPLPSDD